MKTVNKKTVNATPTWASLVPLFIDGIDADNERRKYAIDEIKRMAEICDNYVALQKETTKKGVDPSCAVELYRALKDLAYVTGYEYKGSPAIIHAQQAIENATLKP